MDQIKDHAKHHPHESNQATSEKIMENFGGIGREALNGGAQLVEIHLHIYLLHIYIYCNVKFHYLHVLWVVISCYSVRTDSNYI